MVIDGATTTVKVAHVRLCHSRMMYVRAYPRETPPAGSKKMVFDAHDKAFAFFGGACARGIYDNMKTAPAARQWTPSRLARTGCSIAALSRCAATI